MKKKMPWEPAEFEICEVFADIVTLSGGEGYGNNPDEEEYS